MTDRLLASDVLSLELDDLPLEESDVVAGSPRAGLAELAQVGEVGVGMWELSAGTVTDTEVDEVFVVLAGRGTVEFEDGSVVELRPGAAVRLHAGDRTTWTVTEPLRKVYVSG